MRRFFDLFQGIDEPIPRCFRTTVLTDLYDTTKDIKQAQAAAGHTTAAMTLKHDVKGRQEHATPPRRLPAHTGLETDGKADSGKAGFFFIIREKQPSKSKKTDRKTDKTALWSDEVRKRKTQGGLPHAEAALKT